MRSVRLLMSLAIVGAATVIGCRQLNLQTAAFLSKDKDKDQEEVEPLNLETRDAVPVIGEYTSIAGQNMITLEGVGLVTGLNGTGGDPPPSSYRTTLLEDMRKRGVKSPNAILQSPNTALVVVRAYLPPLIDKGEHFDIEVRLPDSSEGTSLSGGWLLETLLSEKQFIQGRGTLDGHVYAKATGPILVSTGDDDDESLAGVLRRGTVPGGAVSLKKRDLALYLRSDFRSVRNSRRIADAIGKRFHAYNEYGLREPLAEAKTDQKLVLKVHPRYKENYPRYVQVIRGIAFREDSVAQRIRMERLKDELLIPQKSERAAIELEAIGSGAIPTLRNGLKAETLECRFHSAVALAYLGESAGLSVLDECARNERAFRIFAMAAMSTLEDAEANLILRDLMNETSEETRYGAFRALWTLDKNDPFIRGENLNDQVTLHVLRTEGPSLVHLTRHQRPEIVLFGADQQFRVPMLVRAGNSILVTAQPGSDEIVVSRYEVGKEDQRRTVSTRIADVIRAVVEVGGSYPDVVQMLAQAESQQNLPGTIGIDALPSAGRVYLRPKPDGAPTEAGGKRSTRVGQATMTPNLFGKTGDSDSPSEMDDTDKADLPLRLPVDESDFKASESDESEPALTPDSPGSGMDDIILEAAHSEPEDEMSTGKVRPAGGEKATSDEPAPPGSKPQRRFPSVLDK